MCVRVRRWSEAARMGSILHSCPASIYAVMRLDVSINHIRLLPSRKYPGCQPAFCQCSHWLLPTFHYAKCGFLHMRRGVFYREDGQETHPGSIWACQPRKESVPSQQLIVNRFLKACDRVNCNSRQPHPPPAIPVVQQGWRQSLWDQFGSGTPNVSAF